MEDSLSVDSLIVTRKNTAIISDVCLTCKVGDIIGLIGRNGSGKSTLLKAIYGTIKCENIYLNIDDSILISPAYATGKLTYLPQGNYYPSGLKIKSIIKKCVSNVYIDLVMNDELVTTSYDKYCSQLSGGELRYLEIMIALFGKSKYIFLDEPFNSLSPIYIERIINYLHLISEKKGLVIATHNLHDILLVINRAFILRDGYLSEIINYDYESIIFQLIN